MSSKNTTPLDLAILAMMPISIVIILVISAYLRPALDSSVPGEGGAEAAETTEAS